MTFLHCIRRTPRQLFEVFRQPKPPFDVADVVALRPLPNVGGVISNRQLAVSSR